MCDTERRSKSIAAAEIERLYRKHGAAIAAHARRMLGDASEADDVVHEVFARLISDPPELRAKEAIGSWLHGAATFACFKRRRAVARRQTILAGEIEARAPEPDQTSAADQRLDAQDAIARMPSELRRLAIAYYVKDMTQEQIATAIGCSRRNVGYKLEKLRRAFRDLRSGPGPGS